MFPLIDKRTRGWRSTRVPRRTFIRLMEAFVKPGNRAAAIEPFDGLRKMLRRELRVDPLPATIAKYEALIK